MSIRITRRTTHLDRTGLQIIRMGTTGIRAIIKAIRTHHTEAREAMGTASATAGTGARAEAVGNSVVMVGMGAMVATKAEMVGAVVIRGMVP